MIASHAFASDLLTSADLDFPPPASGSFRLTLIPSRQTRHMVIHVDLRNRSRRATGARRDSSVTLTATQ